MQGKTSKATRAITPSRQPHSSTSTSTSTSTSSKSLAEVDRRFRQLYASPVDFEDLARRDADFAAVVVKGRGLDFRDPKSVKQLTRTLLRVDFGIEMELPDDRLCPPVPNRHNYILWLKQLLDTSSYNEPGQSLTGLDIGTGASCIYPLLGCVQRPWSFIATDIDPSSLAWARKNVQLNGLADRISIVARTPSDQLVPLDELGIESVDFVMTNPPFYESDEDLERSAKLKKRPPYTACTGSKTEMVTPGGEAAFVDGILRESLLLRDRVQWYTAMFGFLSSVTGLVDKIRRQGVSNYAVTEFAQGNKTRRWAVAWSFGDMRPAQAVARGTKAAPSRNMLPLSTEADVFSTTTTTTTQGNVGDLMARLTCAIEKLDLTTWKWDQEACEGTGRAPGKVWARAWRRRKKRGGGEDQEACRDGGGQAADMFGFGVCVRVTVTGVCVSCRWLQGVDASVFESFQGYLKATATEAARGLQGSGE